MAIVLPALIFHRILEARLDEGFVPLLMGYAACGLWGFLAAIPCAVALRRMRIHGSASRGRVLAFLGAYGWRTLLMAHVLLLAMLPVAGWLSRTAESPWDIERYARALWLVGGLLVLWHLIATFRRVRQPLKGGGWAGLFGGMASHLLLLLAVFPSVFGAMFTLHPEFFQGGPRNRRADFSGHFPAAYAVQEREIDPGAGARLTVRLWEKGVPREIASRRLDVRARMRWVLREPETMIMNPAVSSGGAPVRESAGEHWMEWTLPPGQSGESTRLRLPEETTLLPTERGSLLGPAATNVWLFLPSEIVNLPPPANAKPAWALELVLHPADARAR